MLGAVTLTFRGSWQLSGSRGATNSHTGKKKWETLSHRASIKCSFSPSSSGSHWSRKGLAEAASLLGSHEQSSQGGRGHTDARGKDPRARSHPGLMGLGKLPQSQQCPHPPGTRTDRRATLWVRQVSLACAVLVNPGPARAPGPLGALHDSCQGAFLKGVPPSSALEDGPRGLLAFRLPVAGPGGNSHPSV